mmetsp:Transcript_119191/g.379952  ORF Transcript_119191/g.379952 Transcript_119191/m.379952 type:complete len:109 (+) Transcript_119191:420-746(+)
MPVYFLRVNDPDAEANGIVPGALTQDGSAIMGPIYDASTGKIVGGLSMNAMQARLSGAPREVRQVWTPETLAALGRDGAEQQPLAKTLPKDVMLWAAALMRGKKRGSA